MTTYPQPQLTDEQLAKFTGQTQAAAQCRWLKKWGIPFVKGPDGRPRTTWGVIDATLLGEHSEAPNFAALKESA